MKHRLTILALAVSTAMVMACGEQPGNNTAAQNNAVGTDQQTTQTSQTSAGQASGQAGFGPAEQADAPAQSSAQDPAKTTAQKAVAELVATEGNKASGTVNFQQTPDGVTVTGRIEGLSPGEHGFHVHENGDCSSTDSKSAGGHFAPAGHKHGASDAAEHHAGDMGNITANEDGVAQVDAQFAFLKMGEGEASIIGKAVIVHGGSDDLESQPSGDAGPRVACGVIEAQRHGY